MTVADRIEECAAFADDLIVNLYLLVQILVVTAIVHQVPVEILQVQDRFFQRFLFIDPTELNVK